VLPVEQVRQVRFSAHPQPGGNPSQRHRRFFAQSPRDGDLPRITLASLHQSARVPATPLSFRRHNPPGFAFRRFPQLPAVMPVAGLREKRRRAEK
jgi:hypothetical protein